MCRLLFLSRSRMASACVCGHGFRTSRSFLTTQGHVMKCSNLMFCRYSRAPESRLLSLHMGHSRVGALPAANHVLSLTVNESATRYRADQFAPAKHNDFPGNCLEVCCFTRRTVFDRCGPCADCVQDPQIAEDSSLQSISQSEIRSLSSHAPEMPFKGGFKAPSLAQGGMPACNSKRCLQKALARIQWILRMGL